MNQRIQELAMQAHKTFDSLQEARRVPDSQGGIWAKFAKGRLAHGEPADWEAVEFVVAKHGEVKFPEYVLIERHHAA